MHSKRINLSTYFVGGLIGAFIGIVAAFLIEKSSDLEGEEHQFTGKRLQKLGLGTISILWQLIDRGKRSRL